MSTIIDCPSCRRKLRVPDELAGQKVKCPTCNATFALVDEPPGETDQPGALATGASATAPAASNPLPTVELDKAAAPSPDAPRPPEETSKQLDEDEDDERPWERPYQPYQGVRRDSEPHRANIVLTLGILSIVLSATVIPSIVGLALGITAWIMGYRDMKKMRANLMDPQGFGSTQAGFICGIVGTCLGSICSLYCLGNLAVWVFMVGASRMTPTPTKTTPAPVPKKAPAKPGKEPAFILSWQPERGSSTRG